MTKKLVRKGKCNHCGLCCGWGTRTPCENFNLETMRCMVHQIAQPTYCKTFPKHPRCIPVSWGDTCGFKFYDAETGQEITLRKHKNAQGNWECDWNEVDQYEDVIEECDDR